MKWTRNIAEEHDLGLKTLQMYAKKWRSNGVVVPRLILSARDEVPPGELRFPYIRTTTPSSDEDLVLAVHRAVPNGLSEAIRADVCQDLLVALIEGTLLLVT